jgi:hypothetical protein
MHRQVGNLPHKPAHSADQSFTNWTLTLAQSLLLVSPYIEARIFLTIQQDAGYNQVDMRRFDLLRDFNYGGHVMLTPPEGLR